MAEEFVDSFRLALAELNESFREQIHMLTELVRENRVFAAEAVECIRARIREVSRVAAVDWGVTCLSVVGLCAVASRARRSPGATRA